MSNTFNKIILSHFSLSPMHIHMQTWEWTTFRKRQIFCDIQKGMTLTDLVNCTYKWSQRPSYSKGRKKIIWKCLMKYLYRSTILCFLQGDLSVLDCKVWNFDLSTGCVSLQGHCDFDVLCIPHIAICGQWIEIQFSMILDRPAYLS